MTARLSANSRLAKRYAKALYELALEKGVLDSVEKDLLAIKAALASSKELSDFTKTPLISREDKASAISALLTKAGANKETISFANTLAQNSRLEALEDSIEEVQLLCAQHRGEIAVQVISAVPLQESQRSAISSALVASLGKKVKLELAVEADILGGVIVKVGSKMLDNSLKSKLERLKTLDKQILVA